MTVEAIIFDENGQGVINFEALELKTNHLFIDRVNYFFKKGFEVFDFEEKDSTFDLYLKAESNVFVKLRCWTSMLNKKDSVDEYITGLTEIEKFVSAAGGRIKW